MRLILILGIVMLANRFLQADQENTNGHKCKKDTTTTAVVDHAKEDSIRFIKDTYHTILANHIDYKTFSAKIDVDYIDADDKRYNVNVFLRMLKDSIIWVDIHAFLGIEALKARITKDSVRILDKQNKVCTRTQY